MLAKSILLAALAAIAAAAPMPEWGRHRQGGHGGHRHGHDWNNDVSTNDWNNNDGGNRHWNHDWNHNDSGNNDWNNNDSGNNDWNNNDSSASSDQSNQDQSSNDQSNQDQSSNDQSNQDQSNNDLPKTNNKSSQNGNPAASGNQVTGGFSSIASFYDISNPAENEGEASGSVACSGQKYSNSDWIVAIASQNYDGGSVCGKKVRITDNKTGKTEEATVVDQCMSCQDHQLDLTPSLWKALHGDNTNDGVFDISWEFI